MNKKFLMNKYENTFTKRFIVLNLTLAMSSFLHLFPVFYAPTLVRSFFVHNWAKIDFSILFILIVFNLVGAVYFRLVKFIFMPMLFFLFIMYLKPLVWQGERDLIFLLNKNRDPQHFVNPFLGVVEKIAQVHETNELRTIATFTYNEDLLTKGMVMYRPSHNIQWGNESAEGVRKIYNNDWYDYSQGD